MTKKGKNKKKNSKSHRKGKQVTKDMELMFDALEERKTTKKKKVPKWYRKEKRQREKLKHAKRRRLTNQIYIVPEDYVAKKFPILLDMWCKMIVENKIFPVRKREQFFKFELFHDREDFLSYASLVAVALSCKTFYRQLANVVLDVVNDTPYHLYIKHCGKRIQFQKIDCSHSCLFPITNNYHIELESKIAFWEQ